MVESSVASQSLIRIIRLRATVNNSTDSNKHFFVACHIYDDSILFNILIYLICTVT